MAQTDIRNGITGFIQDGVELKDLYPLFPDCQAIELPFKRTSDNEPLKLIPYNAADKWTTGSIPKFIEESNQSQKFVEKGTKPQFNKFYELTNTQNISRYEIRRKETVLEIVAVTGISESVIASFYANDFKDRVIPQKILLFIQGAGAGGGNRVGGGSGAAASVIIDLPTYETTVSYNRQWVPLRKYWDIYLGKGGTGTTTDGQSGQNTIVSLRSYKVVNGYWPVYPLTYAIITVSGGMCYEGGGISLTDTYFDPLPGPENTDYFLVNYIEGGVQRVPFTVGNNGGVYKEPGYPKQAYGFTVAATNVEEDQEGINKNMFIVQEGGYSGEIPSDHGGGGGSSILSKGGSGGYIFTSDTFFHGWSARLGAGGGGGVRSSDEIGVGGDGGDAAVYLYY